MLLFCPFVVCQHTETLFPKYRPTPFLDVPFWSILPAVCRFCYSCNHFLLDEIWFGRVLCSVNHLPAYPVPELGTKENTRKDFVIFFDSCGQNFRDTEDCQVGTPRHRRRTLRLRMCLEKVFLTASLRTAISVVKECFSNAQSAVVAGVSQFIFSTRILSTPSPSPPCITSWNMLILWYWVELKYKIQNI